MKSTFGDRKMTGSIKDTLVLLRDLSSSWTPDPSFSCFSFDWHDFILVAKNPKLVLVLHILCTVILDVTGIKPPETTKD